MSAADASRPCYRCGSPITGRGEFYCSRACLRGPMHPVSAARYLATATWGLAQQADWMERNSADPVDRWQAGTIAQTSRSDWRRVTAFLHDMGKPWSPPKFVGALVEEDTR